MIKVVSRCTDFPKENPHELWYIFTSDLSDTEKTDKGEEVARFFWRWTFKKPRF